MFMPWYGNLETWSLNPTHALHGRVSYFGFVCVCLSVCSLSKYLKILNGSTSFLVEAFPLTQRENHSILKKKICRYRKNKLNFDRPRGRQTIYLFDQNFRSCTYMYIVFLPRGRSKLSLFFAIPADFFSKSNGFLAGSEGRLLLKNEVDPFNILRYFDNEHTDRHTQTNPK